LPDSFKLFHHPLPHHHSHPTSTTIIQSAFAQAIGKTQQEESPERIDFPVLDIILIGTTGDSCIPVQQVGSGQLDLPTVVFQELLADTRIPDRYFQVKAGSPLAIDRIVKFSAQVKILW
jgi:hypothetical protein